MGTGTSPKAKFEILGTNLVQRESFLETKVSHNGNLGFARNPLLAIGLFKIR